MLNTLKTHQTWAKILSDAGCEVMPHRTQDHLRISDVRVLIDTEGKPVYARLLTGRLSSNQSKAGFEWQYYATEDIKDAVMLLSDERVPYLGPRVSVFNTTKGEDLYLDLILEDVDEFGNGCILSFRIPNSPKATEQSTNQNPYEVLVMTAELSGDTAWSKRNLPQVLDLLKQGWEIEGTVSVPSYEGSVSVTCFFFMRRPLLGFNQS